MRCPSVHNKLICDQSTANPNSTARLPTAPSEPESPSLREVGTVTDRVSPYNTEIFIFLLASTGFYYGYNLSIFNIMGEKLISREFSIVHPALTVGSVNLCFTFGAAVGCIMGFKLSENMGKVRTVAYCELLQLLCYFLYFIPKIEFLMLGRILSGISVGGSAMLISMIIDELIPRKQKNRADLLYGSFVLGSTFLTALLGFFYRDSNIGRNDELVINWQAILTWPVVITAIRYLAFTYLYDIESPVFYINKTTKSWDEIKNKVIESLKITYEQEVELVKEQYRKYKDAFEKDRGSNATSQMQPDEVSNGNEQNYLSLFKGEAQARKTLIF